MGPSRTLFLPGNFLPGKNLTRTNVGEDIPKFDDLTVLDLTRRGSMQAEIFRPRYLG